MGTQPSTLFTLVTDSNQIRWWLSYFWSGVSLFGAAAAAAKSLQSCPTLCDPIDGSSPGSPIPGILQARTLEWVATSFSNAWQWKVKVKLLSHVRLLAALWTAAHQAPLSMGFSRQQYWSGVPLPSPPLGWPVPIFPSGADLSLLITTAKLPFSGNKGAGKSTPLWMHNSAYLL